MPSATLLKEIEETLPPPPKPVGSYVPVIQVGTLVFTSGTLPLQDGKLVYTGKVGSQGVPLEHGQAAAKLCILNCLSIIKSHIGSLENIRRVIRITGYINSAPGFTAQPAIMNSASDFLVEVFGESGKHVRSAVGVAELPLDAAVEVEMIVEVC